MIPRRFISIITVVMLLVNIVCANSVFAYADEYDISDNDVKINKSGSYCVSGKSSENVITIKEGLKNVKLTLEDANITSSGDSPISIGEGSEVVIELIGENQIKAGKNCSGVLVEDTATVTFSGSGSLNVTAGANAAAIGNIKDATAGNIIIENGIITAYGGNGAAAIGAGNGGECGDVVITDGIVAAYQGSGAYAIGGGASGSVSISEDADFVGYSKNAGYALDTSAIRNTRSVALVMLDLSSLSYSNGDELKLQGANNTSIRVNKNYPYMAAVVASAGDYTASLDGMSLVSQDSGTAEFEIVYGINDITLIRGCGCVLTKPDFKISKIFIDNTKQNKEKTVKLSASGSELKISNSCTEHKSSKVTYSYSIVKDENNIAEIDKNSLKVYAYTGGTFTVVVEATATADGFSASTQTECTVYCDADDYNVNLDNVVINKSGRYIITGRTTANTITVEPNLGDVDITLKDLSIDLSKNSKIANSPIYVGKGTELQVHVEGEATLKSNTKGIPICLEAGSSKSYPTSVSIEAGSGVLNLENPSANTAIGCMKGGEYTHISFLTGKTNIVTNGGPGVGTMGAEKTTNVFVSKRAGLQILSTSSTVKPIAGTVITKPYKSHNPAFLVEGRFTRGFAKDKSKLIFREIETGKEIVIDDFSNSYLSFAVALPDTRTVYNLLYEDYGDVERYVHHDDGKNAVLTEFPVLSPFTSFEIFTSSCDCQITSPTLKIPAITIGYEQPSYSITLNASGSQLKIDEECMIHSSKEVTYTYSIAEDESKIVTLNDNILTVAPKNDGKTVFKLRVNANVDEITTEKIISVNVTKMSKADTEKKLGKECVPFMNGYDDGTFRPDDEISRGEAAALVCRLVPFFSEDEEQTEQFPDVDPYSWYYKYIAFLVSECFMPTYPDGTFAPERPITRADFAAAICNSQYMDVVDKGKSKFTDVENHPAKKYIDAMYKKKYVTGYEDGTFRPDSTITRAEVVVIINRILGRKYKKLTIDEQRVKSIFPDVDKKHWAFYEILLGTMRHYEKEWL